MLSVHNLKSVHQAFNYFEKDSYYARRGGYLDATWSGRGAEDLGLAGQEVTPEKFRELLEGKLDGQQIQGGPGGERRPATDLTFSAPKSVSIASLLLQDDERIFDAHDFAVSKAMAYIEEHGAQARVTKGGAVSFEKTGNLLVAQFKHDTSRPVDGRPDPQLHTHCVVINATKTGRGWRAVSNEQLYDLKMLGGAIYRAELARELQKIGYDVERTHADGRFELRGFKPEQIQAFSQRDTEIGREMAARGLSGYVAERDVVLRSRQKKIDLSPEKLLEQWQERARGAGVNRDQLVRGQDAPPPAERKAGARDGLDYALNHLGERQAVIDVRDVLTYATQRSVGRATLDDVMLEVKHAIKEEQLLPTGQDVYTTPEALHIERETLAIARNGKGAAAPLGTQEQATAAARDHGLTPEQEHALATIATSRDRMTLVEGYAGTGKTRMLVGLHDVAQENDWQVRGFAPSAAAAKVLEEQSGIKSTTLAAHLVDERRPGAGGRGARELWVVDEASMVSQRQALDLFRRADDAGARVVIIGDPQQLPAIEAGQPLRQLEQRVLSPSVLQEIHRQKNPELLEAVRHAREHAPEQALRVLDPHVREVPDGDAGERTPRLDAIAKDYLELAPEERARAMVITPGNADREYLNERIREGLEKEGRLHGPKDEAQVLVPLHYTREQMKDPLSYQPGTVVYFRKGYNFGVEKGEYATAQRFDDKSGTVYMKKEDGHEVAWQPREYKAIRAEAYVPAEREIQAGDVIRWTRNDKEHERLNGREATVERVDGKHHVATVRTGDGTQELDLKGERHWEHGYASTVYVAQGATTDRALLHLDTRQPRLVGEQTFYVGVSRAREEVRIYTDDKEGLPEKVQRIQEQKSALEEREKYLKEKARNEARAPREPHPQRQGGPPTPATSERPEPTSTKEPPRSPARHGPQPPRDDKGERATPAAQLERRGEQDAPSAPPPDLTTQAVRQQLRAMGAERYDVGIRQEKSGRMMHRTDQTPEQVEKMVPWLKHQNAQGNHIYIRPAGDEHRLTLVDDLKKDRLEHMKRDGLEPAAAVETSPGKLQAWVKHEKSIGADERRAVARDLAERYEGDRSSTDAKHFGRLAGFTNPKPQYENERGYYPFSVLREASGKSYSDREYLPAIEKRLDHERQERRAPESERPPRPGPSRTERVRPIHEYHRDPRYGGDLHKADMAWARHAAEHGNDRDEISRGILDGRDLSKKGDVDRQREYAERTADKAIWQAEHDRRARAAEPSVAAREEHGERSDKTDASGAPDRDSHAPGREDRDQEHDHDLER